MQEDDLFKKIHAYLRAKQTQGIEIESEGHLAEHFDTTRYRVRKALEHLSQLGLLDETKKRGLALLPASEKTFASRIEPILELSSFDIREISEARVATGIQVIDLSARRISPAVVGYIRDQVANMVRSIDVHQAVLERYYEITSLLISSCGNRTLAGFALSVGLFSRSIFLKQSEVEHEYVTGQVGILHELVRSLAADDESGIKECFRRLLEKETAYLEELYEQLR